MRATFTVLAALMVGFTATTVQSASAAPVPAVRAAEVLHGRVITTAGEPITNAIVSVVLAGRADPIVTVRTDSGGNYEIALPATAGSYSIRVLSLGYSPVTLPLSGPGSIPAEIAMRSFVAG